MSAQRARGAAAASTRKVREAPTASPRTASPRSAPPSPAPACTVAFCPICTVVTTLGEAAPEVAVHLALAGRELLLALRSLIDARLETLDGPEPVTRLERVNLEPG